LFGWNRFAAEKNPQSRGGHKLPSGQAVKLKRREHQLLEYLARRRGEVVTQMEIEALSRK
jgi:DNA-binding winged helix-turn-helix (wHTH) protein